MITYTGGMQAGVTGENLITGLTTGNYEVTVTDAEGCTEMCSFFIQDGGCDLNAEISVTDENCASDCDGTATVTVLSGSAPYSFAWSNGAPDADTATDLCVGNISVTVTADDGCTFILTATIDTEFATPAAAAGADDEICGDTYTLNAMPSVGTGTWTFTTATGGTAIFDNANAANSDVSIDAAGDYTFTWTENNGGCTDADEVTITFQSQPTATVTPDATVCNTTANGSILDLTSLVTDGDTGGTWADTDGTGVDLTNLMNVDFDGIAPGTYTFTYTTASATAGCTEQSYTMMILVEDCDCPSVATTGADDLCNDAATLDLSTLQVTTEAGTWTIVGAPLGSNAMITGTVFDATNEAAGSYTVRFTLDNPQAGCPEFSEQTFNVQQSTNAGTANAAMTLCMDATEVIDLFDELTNADNGGVWTEISANPATGGAFDASAGTFDVNGQNAGTYEFLYTVTGIAPCGNDSETVTIIVNENPDAEAGTGGELSCSATEITLTGSSTTAGVTYNWTTTGGSFVDPTATDNAAVQVNGAGTFTLTVTDTNGCTATDQVIVTQSADVPTADAGGDQSLTCDNNGTVTLDGSNSSSGADVSLAWTDENGAFIADTETITVTTAGVYTLTVTITTMTGTCDAVSSATVTDDTALPTVVIDNGGLIDCVTTSSVLDGSDSDSGANFTTVWTDDSGATVSTDLIYTATAQGFYTLTITNTATGCVNSMTTEVLDASAFPVADAGPDMTLNCVIEEVTLDGTNSQQGNFIYTWEDNLGNEIGNEMTLDVEEPGAYTLSVTDPTNNCENSDVVLVIGDFEPADVTSNGDAEISCDENTGVISVTAEPGNYQWFDDMSNELPNAQGLTLETNTAGTYTFVVMADDNGCLGSATTTIFNNTEAPTGVVMDLNGTTCFGDTDGSALITEVLGGGENYLYALDGGPFTSLPVYDNLEPGDYNLVIQADNGCETDTTFTIDEGNFILLDLGEELAGSLGDEFVLEATVEPESVVLDTMFWAGDSLSCINCMTATAMPMETNTYTFTVIDENGCEASETLTVFVGLGDGVYIPNAFSPLNADGVNDVFEVYTDESIAEVNIFRVYDRWGELMHEATDFTPNDPTAGWDGNYNGETMNTAVFTYYVEVTYVNGETRVITGDVTRF